MAPRKLKGVDPKTATPSKPKILIFGCPGVGKTWASLDFPSVYYIDTEGGANLPHYTDKLKASGALYMGPEDGACEFSAVLDEIQTLATTEHDRKTLVIDSFSKLFNNQIAQTQDQLERGVKEDAFGLSKKAAIKYTRRMLYWFDKLDMNVILICHQKDDWKDGKLQGVTFDGWDKLGYELHLALRIQKEGNSRKAYIGKTRLKEFIEGDSFPWSYAEFSQRYGAAVMEEKAKVANVAGAEEIVEYMALTSKCKIDPALLEKWEAAVPDIMACDTTVMAKRLDWLRKQSAAQSSPSV